MIGRQDVLDRAAEWRLRAEVVEKDYVLGWLLAGIGINPGTATTWVFKGGTCLKKCFFETHRFSEDLDFSLLPQAEYDEEALKAQLIQVGTTVTELSGVDFLVDQMMVLPRQNKAGQRTFEIRLEYRGPLGGPSRPKVRLDLTRHEPVMDPARRRSIEHAYPDQLPSDAGILTYSLAELVAEKTRALSERTLPRDLYDVVLILDNYAEQLDVALARGLFAKKCRSKGFDPPSSNELVEIVQAAAELRAEWANMLAHQLPQLPDVEIIVTRLAPLLAWIDEEVPVRAPVLASASLGAHRDGILEAPRAARYWGLGLPLESVRFAGANRLLIEFRYDGKQRVVEPYSFRRPRTGNLLLYGWELGSTHIKAFNVARISGFGVTNRVFAPRYRVEFGS